MPRDLTLFSSMLDNAKLVVALRQKVPESDFYEDISQVLAVDKLLQNIGEAARVLSQEGRARCPTIRWKLIIGMRNKLVHEYFRTSPELIWRTAHVPIDELIIALTPVVAHLEAEAQKDSQ